MKKMAQNVTSSLHSTKQTTPHKTGLVIHFCAMTTYASVPTEKHAHQLRHNILTENLDTLTNLV